MILIRHGQSEFNVAFAVNRQDPGIRDPNLTEIGRTQALAAAVEIGRRGVVRLIASPYTRALQTASIIAEALDLPVEVDPLVGERAVFACDIGTPRSELEFQWPRLDFRHLPEIWWPTLEEHEDDLRRRTGEFCARMTAEPDPDRIAVVSHWGFIRALTGQEVGNGALVSFDIPRNPADALNSTL
jgi:broad specificity phosphatase PhoE